MQVLHPSLERGQQYLVPPREQSWVKDCDGIMRVHGEFFSEIRPASTLVVVHELVNPEMLLEVEVEAIID